MHDVPPIKGYVPLTDQQVAKVNEIKAKEEEVLALLNDLPRSRWLSIGITHLEQGFMAASRAVLRPDE